MPYRLDESTGLIDYDMMEKTATLFRWGHAHGLFFLSWIKCLLGTHLVLRAWDRGAQHVQCNTAARCSAMVPLLHTPALLTH